MEPYEWYAYESTDEVCLKKLCGHPFGLDAMGLTFAVLRQNPPAHVSQSIVPSGVDSVSPAQGDHQDSEYSIDLAMNSLNRGWGLPGLDLNSG